MTGQVVDAVQMGASAAHNLSSWGLFMQADIVVKLVMILLLAASFWCWSIVVDKFLQVRRLNERADRFEKVFWSGGSLDDLFDRLGERPKDPMSATFVAAMREWRNAPASDPNRADRLSTSLQQRIERVMMVTIGREMGRVERGMTFLASVGSTAPFIGLFGTVWGIMNSFTAIASQQNASLAVVAPGIAEALFATAIGLVAAIPAVLAYNKFSTDLARYGDRLDAFSSEFSAILSRTLEEQI